MDNIKKERHKKAQQKYRLVRRVRRDLEKLARCHETATRLEMECFTERVPHKSVY